MKKILGLIALLVGFSIAQMDLSTPGGQSVLVTFESDPLGAEVYVADTFIGRTPTSVYINADTPTRYKVMLQNSDYGVFEGMVEASEAETINVYLPRETEATPTETPSAGGSGIQMGSPIWRYAAHNFGEAGIVEVGCEQFGLGNGEMCGIYNYSADLFMSEWDNNTRYGNPVEVSPLTSWQLQDDGETLLRGYMIAGQIVIVAFSTGAVLVTLGE